MKILVFKILILLVIITFLAQLIIDSLYVRLFLIIWTSFTELNITYYNFRKNLSDSHVGYGILFGPFYTLYVLFYK